MEAACEGMPDSPQHETALALAIASRCRIVMISAPHTPQTLEAPTTGALIGALTPPGALQHER